MKHDIDIRAEGTPAGLAALYEALANAQGEFDPIVKNRTAVIDIRDKQTRQKIGSYTIRYADLEEITSKTRPALSKYGLATSQVIRRTEKGSTMVTILAHKGGAVLTSEVALNMEGDIKEVGARISYLRRYAKSALLDIAADDDLDEDGQEAGESAPTGESANDNQRTPERIAEPKAREMPEDPTRNDKPASPGQIKMIRATLEKKGKDEAAFCQQIGVPRLEELPMSKVNDALDAARA